MEKETFKVTETFSLFNNFNRTEAGTPRFSESIGRDKWISFGAKNDFPQELLRLLQNADALHTNIINKKIDMVASLGWAEVPALTEFIANEYSRDNLNRVAKEVAFNAIVFGGYYLNLVWDDEGQTIARIKSIPYEKVRIAVRTEEDDEQEPGFYISRDWTKAKKKENEPYHITAFDARKTPEALNKRKAFPSQLLFVRLNPCGLEFYTLPTYHSALIPIKTSYEAWNYQLKSAQRSYQPNLLVAIPNTPSVPQQEQVIEMFKNKGGTDTAGDTVVLFGADKEIKFEVLNPSTNDQKYMELIEKINEEVYIGNQCNSVVAGVAVSGKLGSSSEVLEQYQAYQVTTIAPIQKEIESTFNEIALINGLPKEMKLNNFYTYLEEQIKPKIQNVMHHIRKDY